MFIKIDRLLPAVLCLPMLLQGQETPPADPVPDVLRGAVDPYVPGVERAAFLKAAGSDSEMDESEFKAAAESGAGFVRVYDKWNVIKLFDRNKNNLVDWFEADAYRRALRQGVLARYDKSGNKLLEKDERAEANKDLAAGKAPPISAGPTVAAVGPAGSAPPRNPPSPFGSPGGNNPFSFRPGQLPPELMNFLDTDGDGQLTQTERITAWKNVRTLGYTAFNSQFDKNGDGKLDDEERAQIPSPILFVEKLDKLVVHHWDDNGNGKLDDEEMAAADDLMQKVMEISNQRTIQMLDEDGDGVVSPEEEQKFATMMQSVVFQMLPKAMSWADADGDGQATREEWLGLFNNFERGFDRQVDGWVQRFDANKDGRIGPGEREAMMEGLMADDEARLKRHDKDNDGRLNAQEMTTLIDEVVEEWGIKPAGR